MKINHFLALAVIALLAIGSIGAVSTHAFAQTNQPPVQSQDYSAQDDDTAEAAETGSDIDTIEEQYGEQVEDGQPDGAEDTDSDVQDPSYTGSISVDEAQYEGMSETDEAAALQGKAAISAAEAETAALDANPGATVVKTELDNENGVLVYSVELSNGVDVKVDAGNTAILFTDSGADHEN